MHRISFLEVLPVKSRSNTTKLTRRQMLGRTGKAVAGSAVMTPLIQSAILSTASAAETGLKGVAGIDRVTILPGKTYLRGWAGYGDPPRSNQNRGRQDAPPPPAPTGPASTAIVDQGFRTWRGQVCRLQGVDHHRRLLDTGGLRSTADGGQRPIQEFLHFERIGGDAASGEATRCGLHEEFQNQQPACGAGEPRP